MSRDFLYAEVVNEVPVSVEVSASPENAVAMLVLLAQGIAKASEKMSPITVLATALDSCLAIKRKEVKEHDRKGDED